MRLPLDFIHHFVLVSVAPHMTSRTQIPSAGSEKQKVDVGVKGLVPSLVHRGSVHIILLTHLSKDRHRCQGLVVRISILNSSR